VSDPLISVIVPVHNYAQYVGDCIRSILAQDYPRFELIVVDDASEDASFDVAATFADDARLCVLRHDTNRGYSAAKHPGIRASQGELIVTLDADDMLTDGSLTCRAAAIRDHDVPFVHAYACLIDSKHTYETARARPRKRVGGKAHIHAQCVMLRRELHCRYGLYDESLRSKADKEMWFRLKPRVEMVKIPDIVAYYRKHGCSMQDYRKRNPAYNRAVRQRFDEVVQMRIGDGLTPDNTEMLRS